MKIAPVLLALLATSFAPAARAATLNELNGPLLNKGQWELNALTLITYSTNKDRQAVVGAPGGKANYEATQVTISPAASYGLTDELTLLVREYYVIPYTVSYKHYALPGGPDSYNKNRILARNMLSGSLTWRPSDPWEFSFNGSGTYMGLNRETGDLPASGAVNKQDQQDHSTYLTAQATWLSVPKAGPRTANNRADLDGLLNPLLDRGQAKATLGLTYFRGFSHANMASLNGLSSRLQSASTNASQLSLAPVFSYGLLENLQAKAAVDVSLPNATRNLSRARTINTNSLGVSTYSSERTKSRTLAEYLPSATLTHRLNRQLQWYVSGNYNYQKSSQRGYSVNENTGVVSPDSRVNGFESGTISAGADWISAPRKEGRPLAADLDGLVRPLLERHQFWAGATYSTSRQRNWTAGSPSQPSQTSSVYYGELNYGVRDALQAFASLQITPGYSDKNTFSKFIYPAVKTYGAGLTWRPRQTFQASAETFFSPAVRKLENYDGAGAVTSNSRTDSASYLLNLSATWLW